MCGALFLLAGWLCTRARWKAHFEPVWSNLGLVLLLGGLLSGALGTLGWAWPAWEAALSVAGGVVIAAGWRERRILWFSQGVVAVYVGALRILFEAFHGAEAWEAWLVVAVTSLGLVALLVIAHRRFREDE